MKQRATGELPQSVSSIPSLCVDTSGTAWAVDGNGRLWRLGAGEKPAGVPLLMDGKPVKLAAVAPSRVGELLFVIYGEVNRAASWSPKTPTELTTLSMGKEPRAIGFSNAGGEIWFTSTDTTLNVYADGKRRTVGRDERVSSFRLSQDGSRVLAVRTPTDALVSGAAKADAAWTTLEATWPGEIAGILNDGTAIVLKLGLWTGDAPPPSQVIALDPEKGARKVLLEAPIQAAAAYAGFLAVAEQTKGGKMTLAVYEL